MNKNSIAFGAPGIEPRWTSSAKDGIGTAYHSSSRLLEGDQAFDRVIQITVALEKVFRPRRQREVKRQGPRRRHRCGDAIRGETQLVLRFVFIAGGIFD